jgi:hypothetical protein
VTIPFIAAVLTLAGATAQVEDGAALEFRPRFTSGLDDREGTCKLRLRIDEQTELTMAGDRVTARSLHGRPAQDRGSECTGPLPEGGIREFEFRQTTGRGQAEVVERPDRRYPARVVIRVRDEKAGPGEYTLEFRWSTGGAFGAGWIGPQQRPAQGGTFPMDEAISLCQDVVRGRIAEEHGYTSASFLRTGSVTGRRGWFTGEAAATRSGARAVFEFACHVNLDSGRVREAHVTRR